MIANIFNINSQTDFDKACKRAFDYQYQNISIYQQYVDLIKQDGIPFLPISFFKTHKIIADNQTPEISFSSSGTSGMSQSIHPVADLKVYQHSFMTSFKQFYGSPENYSILALLPSYLEREGSSLILMADELISKSKNQSSGFYLDEYQLLSEVLRTNQSNKIPTILLGVSYALLDLAEQFPQNLSSVIIMETGGMKGNRPEILKSQLHQELCNAFHVNTIHSEYGMTELLSQAYSKGNGKFFTPPWMKIQIRDIYDPFREVETGKTGGINIIDLANYYSCSFIQTDDLGKINPDGSFEILGRLNASDIRGCNLLVQE